MSNKNVVDVESIRSESDALDQSMALSRIVKALLDDKKREMKHLTVVFVVVMVLSILCTMFTVGTFVYYESQFETQDTITTTTTTTQDVEGDSATINNVEGNQYTDQAAHNEQK